MKEIKTDDNKHTIVVYDNIEDMPCVRYHKFNQCLMQACSVGTSHSDIMRKIAGVISLVNNNQPKKAILELKNLSYLFSFVKDAIDPKSQAFACIVKSIDGVECDDITTDGISKTSNLLDKIFSIGERDEVVETVKKKSQHKLKRFFQRRRMTD